MKKRVLITLLICVVSTLFFVKKGLNPNESSVTTLVTSSCDSLPRDNSKLIVAIDQDQLGYFKFEENSYGYWYEILSCYSAFLGRELEIVPFRSISNVLGKLENNTIDIACSMERNIRDHQFTTHILAPKYESNYVVVSAKKNKISQTALPLKSDDLKEQLKDKEVVLLNSFTATKAYNYWLNSINSSVLVTHSTPFELLSKVESGEIQYAVCSKTEAQIAAAKSGRIAILHQFEEESASLIFASNNNKAIESSFKKWFSVFSSSKEFATLSMLYSGTNVIAHLRSEGAINSKSSISKFDDIIKAKSRELGYDWRLISAIAFIESRFRSDVQSHVGASGLMQVMPHVAAKFNIDSQQLIDPSINVDVALRLLNSIKKSIRFQDDTPLDDRISIVLACYNGGLGHVLDARRLATKYGKDPNKWENVSFYLSEKSKEEIYSDEVVKCGKFHGVETNNFVAKVLRQYDKYCLIASLN